MEIGHTQLLISGVDIKIPVSNKSLKVNDIQQLNDPSLISTLINYSIKRLNAIG